MLLASSTRWQLWTVSPRAAKVSQICGLKILSAARREPAGLEQWSAAIQCLAVLFGNFSNFLLHFAGPVVLSITLAIALDFERSPMSPTTLVMQVIPSREEKSSDQQTRRGGRKFSALPSHVSLGCSWFATQCRRRREPSSKSAPCVVNPRA